MDSLDVYAKENLDFVDCMLYVAEKHGIGTQIQIMSFMYGNLASLGEMRISLLARIGKTSLAYPRKTSLPNRGKNSLPNQ